MLLILFFILLLNIIAIMLTYYSLTEIEKKRRIIFIGVGIAILYMSTSVVYWISTKGVELKEVADMGKNIITFLFVPINGIITLPIIARSYCKYKVGKLSSSQLRNRIIILVVLLCIILGVECSYFKDVQNGVVSLVQNDIKEDKTPDIAGELSKLNITNGESAEESANEEKDNNEVNEINNEVNSIANKINEVNE